MKQCDVTQRADLESLVAFANEKLGGIDVVIANCTTRQQLAATTIALHLPHVSAPC